MNSTLRSLLPLSGLSLAALLMAPGAQAHDASPPAARAHECGFTHYVRNGGSELVSTTLTVRNADMVNTATIERLTIRNGQGAVVFDAGPAAGQPLPLNTDFPATSPGGLNVTQVAPGGSVYLRSNHIWGNDGLPPLGAAGNEVGQSLSATVLVSKAGRRDLVSVSTTPRMRARRLDGGGSYREFETLASGNTTCQVLP